MANILQKVQLPIVSDEGECNSQSFEFQNKSQSSSDCGSVYGEERVAASMVCAGWPEGGRDSCQVVSVMVVSGEGGDQHHHHNFVQAGLRGEGASCQVIVIIHDYHNGDDGGNVDGDGDDQQHHDLHHQVLSVMILITSCSVSLPIMIIIMIIRIIMIINVFSRVTPVDL